MGPLMEAVKAGRMPSGMLACLAIVLCVGSGSSGCSRPAADGDDDLVGAWEGNVQFTTGAFAGLTDLRFRYAVNADGTMTESSNYDAAPPVPPAYGVWKRTGPRQYEAKYRFYVSGAVSSADELVKGGGWAPEGYGTLAQAITLSPDG